MSNLSGIPPSPIPLDTDVFDMFMRERSSQLDVALQGRGTSPQAAADARRMSQKTGWTVEEVAKDPRKAEAFLQRQEIESPDFAKRYPLLSSKMDDLEFVDMIRDDMGNLKMTEGAFDYISRSWQVARNTSARGTIGARAALAGRGFTAYERMQLDTFDELARAHAQRDNGFTGAAVELVGSMVDTLGSAVAVGGAASAVNPAAAPFAAGAAAFGESMRLEGGNLYADLIEKGYTPAEAAPLAGIFGAAIGAVDLVGLKVASKPFKETAQAVLPKVFARGLKQETREEAFKQALKSYGAALVGEPTTEAVQEVLQMTAHEVGRKIYPKHAFESDFDISQAGHAFTHTLKGMVVLGGLGAGGHYIADLSKAADAKHTARVFEKMKETAQDSKQRERDPDGRAEFVNEKVAGTPAQTVYVRGDKAAEVLQQMEQEQLEATGESDIREKLEQTMPGLAEQIAEADEAGGDVAIPTGDFEAKLLLTDIGQALVEHSTINADGMTIAEARMFDSMKEAEAEHYREQAAENMARDQELAASAREVEDIAYQQLQATGVMSAKDSRTSAQFYRDFVVTQAADMNITPKEFYDRYPLRVQRGAASERASVFNQERWQQILEQVQEKRAAWMAGDKSPKAMVEVVKLQREAAALLAEPGQAVEFMPNERGQYSLAGPDVRKPGRFRVTQFDESGPVGHVEHATLEEAIRSELSSGKTPRAPRAAFNQDGQRKTDTPEFREWFGESKIVDEDGQPLVVYHGTPSADWSTWDAGGRRRGDHAGGAFFATASPELAGDYAYSASKDATVQNLVKEKEDVRRRILAAHVKGDTQLRDALRDESRQLTDRIIDSMNGPSASEGAGVYPVMLSIANPLRIDAGGKNHREVNEQAIAAAKKAGHDGVVIENVVDNAGPDRGPQTVYVAFDPTQIKSVNNRGTFDRNDPNILRQDDKVDTSRKTDTPEFREWFGESKVVGEDGEPITVFHGGTFSEREDTPLSGMHWGTEAASAERKADWEAARRNAQRFGASEGRPLETTKAYLSMQRPLRVTDDASNDEASLLRYMIQHPVKGVDMAVARRMGSYAALQQAGYDGLVYENEVEDAGSDSYVVFRPDQIKSVNNRGTFDRNDPNILRQDEEAEGQAPRGEFVPESLTVLLGEKADASTFLHESAHYFLSVYADLATQPDAPARVVADMDKLLESFGIEDVHAWNEMTLEQQREHHEAFAYNFEQYLFEGKAPSAALIPLFQRFRAWLTRVYRNIRDSLNDIYRREFGKDLPILTGEVRDVMDRMLASEEQIGQAQHVRSMVPLFQTQEESGMSDAAWEAYQTNAGRADDDAIDAMTQKSLADMRWLSNAQSRVLKEKQQEAREIREAVRAAEKERIEKLPVYRAMTWLRRGETVGPEGDVIKEDGPHKLDNETVQRILGIEKPQKKPRRGKSLVTFIRERGGISHASWTSTFPGETTGEFKLSGVFRGKPRLTAARGTTGLEWEQMAEVARAAGYGPQADVAATENLGTEWFVEALADAANGVHLYRQQDLEAQGEAGTGERAEEPNAASEELLAGTDPRKEDLRRLGWGKNGLLQNDGVHPDRVAEAFGFTSGEALIDALLAAPRMGVAIDEATDARMLAEHSDLTDPEMIRLAVEEAVHNEARARFVTTELKALAKVTQPTRVMVAAAKEAARQILATKAIRDIRPRDYSIAEARAGRAAFRAIQDGDTAEAIRQKQNQLVQNQLATLAAEVRREVEKTNKDFRRVFKTDEKLAKTRDLNTIQAARAVLSLYDLGQASKTPLEHLKPVIAHDPEAWAELSLQVERAVDHANTLDADGRKWKALTLDEYRDLRETIDGLWHKSRRTRQVTLDGKRQDIQGVAARAAEQLEKGLPDLPKVTEADGKKEDAKNGLLSWIANARRIEAFMLTLDGGKPGVMTSLFRRVKEAGDNYRKDAIAAVDAYDELMRNHDFGPNVKIDASEELGYVFRNKSELLGALRHTGNDSNKRKLLLGRKGQKWGELHSDDTLDSSRWDAFVARMIREGKLTKADFDLVQSIWDLNEAQKPAIQKAHYANFGFHMREVEAQSFTNEFGTYRGGYVPARADAKAEPGAARQEIDSLAETQKALPITPRGFTKSRLEGYDRQLSTDLSDGGMHLAQVLRFVHMQEAVNDVKRVLRNPEVEGLLMRHNRSAFRQIIDPWLSHSALQSTGEHAKNPTEKVVGMLSRSANAGIMFANVSNSLQNFTGWFTAATRVKPRHLLSAIGSYSFGQRSQMTKDAAELSTMMANRLGRQMFEVQQQIRAQATQRGAVGKAVDWVRQNTYFLQRITQNVVDVTTWTASYNQGIAQGLNQQEAVRQADSAVRLTQMATDADDISNWEHGGPIQKAIFPFQNWFIGWANNNLTAFQGAETVGARVGVYLYGVMLPMVVAEGISQLVNGRLEDDDDDGWGDDMADLWWRSQLSGTLAAMPGVGRFGQLVVNRFLDDEVWNDRMPAPPFVSVMTKGLDALVDIKEGKGNRRDIEDLTTFFGNLTGLPLGTLARMASYQIGVASGDVEPEGPFGETFDFLRGTVTGRAGAAGR